MSKAGKCYCLGRCAEQENLHSDVILTDIVAYVLLKISQLSLCCIQTVIKIEDKFRTEAKLMQYMSSVDLHL